MITVYDVEDNKLCSRTDAQLIGEASVWIDLVNPTPEEDTAIEQALSIDIPTRSEMREIEASNRFYTENDTVYMTGITLHNPELPVPQTSGVTFILAGKRLITVRYAEPRAFPVYVARVMKGEAGCNTGPGIMTGLIEMLIERQADLIEKVQDEVETIAPQIFAQRSAGQSSRPKRLDALLRTVGKEGDICSRALESFMSLHRLSMYALNALRQRKDDPAIIARLETAHHDISSLMESLRILSSRTAFLLDATLGSISNEQNQIIKLFSVMAVMLMPPTLVASVYGMNFKHMPELDWPYGYPMALGLMVISAVIPFIYFRRKGWM